LIKELRKLLEPGSTAEPGFALLVVIYQDPNIEPSADVTRNLEDQ
jgi:hypothetical protein